MKRTKITVRVAKRPVKQGEQMVVDAMALAEIKGRVMRLEVELEKLREIVKQHILEK